MDHATLQKFRVGSKMLETLPQETKEENDSGANQIDRRDGRVFCRPRESPPRSREPRRKRHQHQSLYSGHARGESRNQVGGRHSEGVHVHQGTRRTEKCVRLFARDLPRPGIVRDHDGPAAGTEGRPGPKNAAVDPAAAGRDRPRHGESAGDKTHFQVERIHSVGRDAAFSRPLSGSVFAERAVGHGGNRRRRPAPGHNTRMVRQGLSQDHVARYSLSGDRVLREELFHDQSAGNETGHDLCREARRLFRRIGNRRKTQKHQGQMSESMNEPNQSITGWNSIESNSIQSM
mmetsp:Transcript_16678/g.36353  ORF Transcript_16678/g.36353 Transcript_16678/m.36353 type:complete len:290 (+) Transcript_16678:441-1310(+)